MGTEAENMRLVRNFLAAWEGGPYAKLRGAYEDYLDDQCVYENPGLPTCKTKDEALALIDGIHAVTDIQSITAELRGIAAACELVFTERIDHHFNSRGEENLTPHICGVMEIRNGTIVGWRDYYDPAAVLAAMTAHG